MYLLRNNAQQRKAKHKKMQNASNAKASATYNTTLLDISQAATQQAAAYTVACESTITMLKQHAVRNAAVHSKLQYFVEQLQQCSNTLMDLQAQLAMYNSTHFES